MTSAWRRRRIGVGTLVLIGWVGVAVLGCTPAVKVRRQQYQVREKSFKLIDEGKRFEVEGSRLLALERYNRAATVYDSPAAFFQMGRLFEFEAKYPQAATAYQQALVLAPDYQEAKFAMLAIGYTPPDYEPTEGDLALAAQQAREVELTVAEEIPLAEATEELPDPERIRRRREQMIAEASARRMPTEAEVQAVLFEPREGQGRLPSATDPVYATTQNIVLGSYPYHFSQAEQMERRHQYDRAAEEYQRAFDADPTKIAARLKVGDMMMSAERHPQARYHYERAEEEFPGSPRPQLKLGNYFLALEQPERATERYRRALDIDPYYVEAYNNLGFISIQAKDFDNAAAMFDQIIKLDPQYANAYLNRGILASDIDGDKETALRCFNQYVELGGPRVSEVRSWLRELQGE